jgi:ABC-type nitrate/sulfonate/bicarbonate transport system ATPase subunit
MDEPFGALDEQARKHMDLELLKIWEKERRTVLFVTHNIEEAVMLSTRIVLMDAHPGRIVREWKVGIPRPRDPFQKEVTDLKMELSRALQAVLEECGCKRSETYAPIVPGLERTIPGEERWKIQE